MEPPNAHYFHVVLRCDGLRGQTQDFKMPVWTPGYYEILNYAKDVTHFHAEDAGKPLLWEKTSKNIWRVHSGGAASITVSYDVYAFTDFIANSYLDEERAYISPAGVFVHVAGQIQHPVTVTIKPCSGFKVATGLDQVDGQANTFSAPDFDVLYDCPILMGNLETLPFEVQGIPHVFAGAGLGTFDRKEL
jgi:predicted metalloprotease with PDZ domain